jgi:ubiquinone/menaquinone biosynthesis C-methylase UbiE
MPKPSYIPALNQTWLTPLYDPILKWVFQETGFKQALITDTAVQAGQRVLDLGCGTATLTIWFKQQHPDIELHGIDIDPQVLLIARKKAKQAGVSIQFQRGYAPQLAYASHTFDRVVSSLVFHHLTIAQKGQALKEAHRILKPGGTLHIVDFDRPQNSVGDIAASLLGWFEETEAHFQGRLPALFRSAGFGVVQTRGHFLGGLLSLYRLQKP